jgi:hypothetical protein
MYADVDEELILAVANAKLSSPSNWCKFQSSTSNGRHCLRATIDRAEQELINWFDAPVVTSQIHIRTLKKVQQCIDPCVGAGHTIEWFNDLPTTKFTHVKNVLQCALRKAQE